MAHGSNARSASVWCIVALALGSTSHAFVGTPVGTPVGLVNGPRFGAQVTRNRARPAAAARPTGRSRAPVAGRPMGMQISAGTADEDDWYGSDNWESFRKSGARVSGARQGKNAEAQGPGNTGSASGDVLDVNVQSSSEDQNDSEGQTRPGDRPEVEWMRVAGSDVCLPKERRKPIGGGARFSGLVHMIGGAFVGTLPRQAYGVLIELLVAKGRVVVVATPCSGLAGMDHYKAAYEAAFKFQTACSVLRRDLGADVFDADRLPTIGLGHSLGCKVQILMNSIADTRAAAGRQRCANVHLAFNNYAASESIPIVKELSRLQADVSRGIAAAAPVLEQISTAASELKSTAAFKDVLGTPEANQAFSFLENLGNAAKTAAGSMGGEVLDEFSPSPADTVRLLSEDYAVSRNLVVKFLDDSIDQSVPLCEKLREKFTGPEGSGGRLDLRRLPGSHVTPNTPDLANLAEGRANLDGLEDILGDTARQEADAKMQQVEMCAEVVLGFLKDEFARDWLREPASSRPRIGGVKSD